MRRSERIVRLTQLLLESPHKIISLTEMAERLSSAKSSLSEDLSIIRDVLEEEGSGRLETLPGAAGGVRYIPGCSLRKARAFVDAVGMELAKEDRILPGGYLYMSDVLGRPYVLDMAGRMFASRFAGAGANVVITVETKGIPLAVATSRYLQIPAVVVRRDNRVTEGSAVSINYVSGSGRRIQTMSLSRRSLPDGARALIIDDFMKAGGTSKAVTELIAEFVGACAGIGVFMATSEPEVKLVDDYVSLTTLKLVDETMRQVEITPGTFFYNQEVTMR